MLIPEEAVTAHAEGAIKAGADLRTQTAVTGWTADAGGVTVSTGRETFQANHLVIAAGAWAGQLLRELEIELSITRQVLAWFEPRNPSLFHLGSFPCWFVETDPPFGHYGFPILPGGPPGFKVALHQPGEPIDPDRLPDHPGPSAAEIATLREFLQEFIPEAAGPLLSSRQCLYTNSPDHHFIIDRHPDHERVSLACGFSGHGFKFASVVGEIMADLATEGRTGLPAQFLNLARFS